MAKRTKTQALIIRTPYLPQDKRALIQMPTPQEFIKERPGKGGKTFRYIEGGFVIARLNQIFSPIGWDFEVVDTRIEPREVLVRGRLSVKDFKTGFTIGKTRTGTKERNADIPLGDTVKAAETDSLKKCASHFGIGLDVYWQQLDEEKGKGKSPKVTGEKIAKSQLMKLSKNKIEAETDPTILAEMKKRIMASTKVFNKGEQQTLVDLIDKKIKQYGKSGQKPLL